MVVSNGLSNELSSLPAFRPVAPTASSPGVGTFGRIGDAASGSVVLQPARSAPDQNLNPVRRRACTSVHGKAVHAVGDVAVFDSNSFRNGMSFAPPELRCLRSLKATASSGSLNVLPDTGNEVEVQVTASAAPGVFPPELCGRSLQRGASWMNTPLHSSPAAENW